MALPAVGGGRVPVRRGVLGPRGGGVFLPRVQQTRLLDAAVAVVAEEGLSRLSVARVSARAGMSSKTFYDLFADREDCFLAVFDRAVGELAALAAAAWAGDGEWVARMRSALIVLLASLERDPALARVVFVEALAAGPRVLARRAEVLDHLALLIDEGRAGAPAGLPALVAPSVAGAAFSIIHAGLLQLPGWGGASRSKNGLPTRPAWRATHASDRGRRDAPPIAALESLMELVGPVMATVVLPYRGGECSARELARPVPGLPALPEPAVLPERVVRPGGAGRDLLPLKLTERTCAVLAAVVERPGANNRQVAAGAGASEPQVSRLLARLADHGLVENRGGGRGSHAKAWWLTASGVELLRTGRQLRGAEPAVGSARSAGRGKGKSSVRAGRIDPLDVVAYQRVRLLRAAAVAVDEHGYGAVTVADIAACAKVSRRTFYELFDGREQCLLAVMANIDAQLTAELQEADLGGLPWRERVRLGLWTILRFFDREPVLARFCVVESARGDERMATYRAELLARITAVIAEGAEENLLGESSPLVAEGVAGGVVSILSTRLAATGRRATGRSRKDIAPRAPLSDLLGELMALVVLPYPGPEVAHEERARPAPSERESAPLPVPDAGSKQGGKCLPLDPAPAAGPAPRMTYRTALVLEAIAQTPGLSNLDVARHAQINDQGQISKLLARLQRHGLVQNTGRRQGQGAPNEWRLTPAGQKLERDIHEHTLDHAKQAAA